MKIDIQDAIQKGIPIHVHTVSGENYRGTCQSHQNNPNLFIINTPNEVVILPRWVVKRIKSEL